MSSEITVNFVDVKNFIQLKEDIVVTKFAYQKVMT